MSAHLNVAVVGHVHHGKSTIIGRLLLDLGKVTPQELRTVDRYIEERGLDQSHRLGLLVHRLPDERVREHTEVPAWARLEIGGKTVTLVDTPGHYLFQKNMIYGIYQADAAILVVQASEGIQEQTLDALHVLKCFDIPLLAVTISRMDEVQFSQDVFGRRRGQVEQLLNTEGIARDVPFFPSAGLLGEGVTGYRDQGWWSVYPSLTSVLDAASAVGGVTTSPTRFVFRRAEMFSPVGVGLVLVGVVESGRIAAGDSLLVEPVSALVGTPVQVRVKSIHLAKAKGSAEAVRLDVAVPRQIVGLAVDTGYFDLRQFFQRYNVRACVCGNPEQPPTAVLGLRAELIIVEHPTSIPLGYGPVLSSNGDQVGCIFAGFDEKREPGGEWQSATESLLRVGDQARIRVEAGRPIVVEHLSTLSRLGKVLIRDQRRIVALGRSLGALQTPHQTLESRGPSQTS